MKKTKSVGLASLALAVLLVGCSADSPGGMESKGQDSLNQGVVSADPTKGPRTVTVTLREYEIAMPRTLAPGAYLFSVRNEGSEDHGIDIEGNGMQASLPTSVQPGETQQLPIDLAPGTYRVYCPVGEHGDRGMSLELEITE